MPLPSYEELAGSTSLPSYDELARQPSFDTTVPFERVPEFEQWIKRYAPPQDSGDYDYGGAFLAGVLPDSKGHWPDTFKKPNHPTFSDESQYAKDAPERAGHWNGEVFTPRGALPSYDELAHQPPSGVTLSDLMSGKYGDRIPKDVHIPTVNETGWIPAPIVEAALRYGNPLGWAQVAAEHYDPNNPITQAGKGAIQGLSSTIAGATTPENLSLLALAPEGKLAQRLIAGTFLGQSIAGTPEQWDAFNKADNLADKFKIGTEMGLGLAFPAAGLAHSFKAGEVPKTADVSAVPKESSSVNASEDSIAREILPPTTDANVSSDQSRLAAQENQVPQPEITPPIVEPSIKEKADLGKPEPQELSGVQGQMALPTRSLDEISAEAREVNRVVQNPNSTDEQFAAASKRYKELSVERELVEGKSFPSDVSNRLSDESRVFYDPLTESAWKVRDLGDGRIAKVRLQSGHSPQADAAGFDAIKARLIALERKGDRWFPAEAPKETTTLRDSNPIVSTRTASEVTQAPVSPKEIPQSATGEPNALSQRSTTEEVPSPIERGENQQVSGERVRPGEQGKEVAGTSQTPEESQIPLASSDDPFVSRIANRFSQERATRGEIGEVAPRQGYATADLVNRGLRMLPEEINQHVSDIMRNEGNDPVAQAAAIRAEEARLSDRSTELSRVAESNPTNLTAQHAANSAFQDLTDFHNGPVAKLKQRFHASGMALQREIPVDLSTFNGLREDWLKNNDRSPPSSMDPTFRRTARNVSRAVTEERAATNRLGQEIDKATRGRKLPSADEVRNNIRERMGLGPCRI